MTRQLDEDSRSPATDPGEIVLGYHQRTKHHFDRYARSLGFMDWANQPDPFRRYEGAPLVRLPIPREDQTPTYDTLYQPGSVQPRPVSLESISEFFFYSLALSAWKTSGTNTWPLRVNPSSGNLHPSESYLIMDSLAGLSDCPAVHHYAPREHGLERRAELDSGIWSKLIEKLPPSAFLVALTSIPWRESWKYGERAYRYCQHDVGHALAALRFSAMLQGWSLYLLPAVGDEEIERLVGIDRKEEFVSEEPEVPDLLTVVLPKNQEFDPTSVTFPDQAITNVADGRWIGKANHLSNDHHPWEIIDVVEHACRKSAGSSQDPGSFPSSSQADVLDSNSELVAPAGGKSAGQIIRQRRSAVDMDGLTGISQERFEAMLARLLPSVTQAPWDCFPAPPLVHLGMFVHRVEGLRPGLYAFLRDPLRQNDLTRAMRSEFLWERPSKSPATLPLFLLLEGDAQRISMQLSCNQHIAAAGAFSLGMIAEFEPVLRQRGPHFYRRLFWETGMIGQVLYLEAEAAGIRSTGIGCFFDDPVHELFGLQGMDFQSLYHFTVGGPVEDIRINSLPAYPEVSR